MNDKIICKKGKCYEPDSLKNRISKLFDKDDPAEQIEQDLIMESI